MTESIPGFSCPSCGAASKPAERICRECGTPFERPARGSRTKEHLASRELPGEIKVVLGISAAIGVLGLVNVVLCFIIPSRDKTQTGLVAAANLAGALLMGTVFLGLLRRTRWGWWLATILFGLLLGLYAVGAVASMVESISRRDAPAPFFGSGCGSVAITAFAVVLGAPFWLLLRCRRRYFQLARRGPVENR